MLQAFTQKLLSYLPGSWVFRSGSATDTHGCPGGLGHGGFCHMRRFTKGRCSISPFMFGSIRIRRISAGKVSLHES